MTAAEFFSQAADAIAAPEAEPATPAHITMINGRPHQSDPKGRWIDQEMIQPAHLLEDEAVRKVVEYAVLLQAQIARFRDHTIDDIASVKEMLAQEHGTTVGGEKGNISLTTFDGLLRVSVKIADLTEFGPELQLAKSKVTECLRTWSQGADAKLVAVVENAFQVDQAGQINRSNLLYLTRLNIEEPLWKEAMALIRAAERPMGTKEYVQIHRKARIGARWEHVAIDMSAVA